MPASPLVVLIIALLVAPPRGVALIVALVVALAVTHVITLVIAFVVTFVVAFVVALFAQRASTPGDGQRPGRASSSAEAVGGH